MKAAVFIGVVSATLCSGVAIAGDVQGLPVDLTKQSVGFWNDWNALKQTDKWQKLEESVGVTAAREAALKEGVKQHRQPVFSVSLRSAANTAKFLDAAAATSSGAEASNAIATALEMRASPKMVKAAEPLVQVAARTQVQQWRASLDTGIAGLPGIYLSDHASANADIPAGYQPVSGGSIGCGE